MRTKEKIYLGHPNLKRLLSSVPFNNFLSDKYQTRPGMEWYDAISDALAKDAIVTASCYRGENVLEGIADWHAYSVLSWNEDEGTVGLRNPWGRGEPVNENGKARDGRDDGRFQLSLEEFLQNFRAVTREEL